MPRDPCRSPLAGGRVSLPGPGSAAAFPPGIGGRGRGRGPILLSWPRSFLRPQGLAGADRFGREGKEAQPPGGSPSGPPIDHGALPSGEGSGPTPLLRRGRRLFGLRSGPPAREPPLHGARRPRLPGPAVRLLRHAPGVRPPEAANPDHHPDPDRGGKRDAQDAVPRGLPADSRGGEAARGLAPAPRPQSHFSKNASPHSDTVRRGVRPGRAAGSRRHPRGRDFPGRPLPTLRADQPGRSLRRLPRFASDEPFAVPLLPGLP